MLPNAQTFALFDIVKGKESNKLKKFINTHSQDVSSKRKSNSVDWNARWPHESCLHIACRQDDMKCMELLISIPIVDVNLGDLESGMSPISTALYYGNLKLALRLLELRPDVKLQQQTDNDGHTALETLSFVLDMNSAEIPSSRNENESKNLSTQSSPTRASNSGDLNEDFTQEKYVKNDDSVITWGSNVNYNLGHTDGCDRQAPEVIPLSMTEAPLEILFSKYHSAIIGVEGGVWIAGHGNKGRLGNGTEEPQLTFKKVNVPEVSAGAISSYHSILITKSGSVFTCGLNDLGQLGNAARNDDLESFQPVFKKITSLRKKHFVGAAASRVHSVAFTRTEMYTWGLNKGQLGYKSVSDSEYSPRLVSALPEVELKQVCANESSTLCLTVSGDLFLFYNYSIHRITLPEKLFKSRSKSVKIQSDRFRYGILDSVGTLYSLNVNDEGFNIQTIRMSRNLDGDILDFALSIDSSFLLLSGSMKVFNGYPTRNRRLSSFSSRHAQSLSDNPDKQTKPFLKIVVSPIPGLKFVRKVFSGPSGSYAAIRENYPLPVAVHKVRPLTEKLKDFYDFTGVISPSTFSLYSDMEIISQDRLYKCHKTILAARSAIFRELFDKKEDTSSAGYAWKDDKLEIFDADEKAVQGFLHLAYFDEFIDEDENSMRDLMYLVILFSLEVNARRRKCESQLEDLIRPEHVHDKMLIRCLDGDVECPLLIIALNSHFFEAALRVNSIFQNYSLPKHIIVDHISTDQMKRVIDFVYMPSSFKYIHLEQVERKDLDDIRVMLEVSDELLIDDLKSMCENALIKLINLSTVEYLAEIGEYYCCESLTNALIVFIACHLEILFSTGWKFSSTLTDLIEIYIGVRIEQVFQFSRVRFPQQIQEKLILEKNELKLKTRNWLNVVTATVSSCQSSLNSLVLAQSERSSVESSISPVTIGDESVEVSPSLPPMQSTTEEMIFQLDPDPEPLSVVDESHISKTKSTPKKKSPSKMLTLSEFHSKDSNTLARSSSSGIAWNVQTSVSSTYSLSALMKEESKAISGQSINTPKKTPSKRISQKEKKQLAASTSKSPQVTTQANNESPWKKTWPGQTPSTTVEFQAFSLPSPIPVPISTVHRPAGSPWNVVVSPPVFVTSPLSISDASPSFKEIQSQQKEEINFVNKLTSRRKNMKVIQMEEKAVIEIRRFYELRTEPESGETFEIRTVIT